MLNVDSLSKGVVIDHIKAGNGMDLYNFLHMETMDCCIAIIQNARSERMGKKDIIKIEGILELDLEILGFIDHNITVNIIDGGRIIEKKNLTLPNCIKNVMKCKNPRCISVAESGIDHIFKLCDSKKHLYRCIYCEQEFQR